MDEKRVIYDHNIDQKKYKWSGEMKLHKIKENHLPTYVVLNKEKYKLWFD